MLKVADMVFVRHASLQHVAELYACVQYDRQPLDVSLLYVSLPFDPRMVSFIASSALGMTLVTYHRSPSVWRVPIAWLLLPWSYVTRLLSFLLTLLKQRHVS